MEAAMRTFVRTIVRDYGWIHLSIGLFGNLIFFVGSILFLPALRGWLTTGVWLFIAGSLLMAVGALGQLLVNILKDEGDLP
jgi:hypothetical protein